MPDYLHQDFPVNVEVIPFKIEKEVGGPDNSFYVQDGICYSTYSLETGSFLKIDNLNTPFLWNKNEKIFIEVDVAVNLGIKNAKIKNEKVGEEAPEDGWVNYPYFYKIEPQDEFTDGRVSKIRDGKKQTKCYVLIGYLDNDETKNGTLQESKKEEDGPDIYIPVQILKENIIFIQSMVSGIPCLAPFPYFKGGLTHLLSIQKDLRESGNNSSSSSSTSSNSSQ